MGWFNVVIDAHPYLVGCVPMLLPLVLYVFLVREALARRNTVERQARAAWREASKPRHAPGRWYGPR